PSQLSALPSINVKRASMHRIKRNKFIAALGVVALLLLPVAGYYNSVAGEAQAVITLNPALTYQTISGWEATVQAGQMLEVMTVTHQSNANPAFAIYSGALFSQLVDDLGVSRLRLEIGEGAENTTDYFTQYLNGQIPFDDKLTQLNPVNDDSNPLSVDSFIS